MKCFTATTRGISSGIEITSAPYPHIGVGEQGRGRQYSRFPIAQDFADKLVVSLPCPYRGENIYYDPGYAENPPCHKCGEKCSVVDGKRIHPDSGSIPTPTGERITRASVIKTRAKGTMLLVPETNTKDNRIIVLVNIEAGYRGGTSWSGIEKVVIPCPHRNTTPPCSSYAQSCFHCEEALEKVGEEWVHPDRGGRVQRESFPTAGVTVLAEGIFAQGDAGRMGSHLAFLLIMEPGAGFRVVRSGRLYGASAERIVFYDGDTLRIGTHDEIFPPSSLDEVGELI